MRTTPAGVAWLFVRKAATNWSGVILCERIKSGFAFITIVRALPPKGAGETRPGIDVKPALMYTLPKSCNSLLVRIGLLKISWPIGRVEASNRKINGGLLPGGKMACALLLKAETSAPACAILVPG